MSSVFKPSEFALVNYPAQHYKILAALGNLRLADLHAQLQAKQAGTSVSNYGLQFEADQFMSVVSQAFKEIVMLEPQYQVAADTHRPVQN